MATLLKMTLSGSLTIIWVLLARLLMCRSPKKYSYALWAVVILRLLCPVFPQAQVSLMVQPVSMQEYIPAFQQETVPQIVLDTSPPDAEADNSILSIVWVTGVLFMAGSGLAQLRSLKRKLRTAVLERENIYLCDWVASPFVLGLFRPRIYLPSGLEDKEFIIAHERCHIRRLDHWAKLFGYIALCIHWFNPMVWLAFRLACRDMEMSCDEAVLRKLGENVRSDYSQSLLNFAVGNHMGGITPAFGEGDVKMRIKNILRWKESKWWHKGACMLVCLVVLVGCGVDKGNGNIVRYEYEDIVIQLELPNENWEYEIVEYAGEEYCHGIRFWPKGHDVDLQKLCLFHWPMGYKAGPSFKIKENYVLENGSNVEMGARYEHNIWEYIQFIDEEKDYVLTSICTDKWWEEYAEECTGIINSIRFE